MTAPTGPQSPAWHDTDTDTVRTHAVYAAPADQATPAATKPARTVSARIAAVVGVVAFLLGAGLSMLTGPLLGGGPGGPGDGGPGGPPGTSQQSGTGADTGTAGTGTTGTGTTSS
ncbi:hypothetical protein [Actinomycetospora termitidis]|uniref:Uncharacterized protein n=1 Tax=Actinomycetospora termitidis TaxID=3053470 RepID=A0ABT7M590_9PSEU|nr:hypothetical protein [Actinomycetospora sp. Odt1-22]MDL5155826.1 hypothetical protein [Actinomycetospora sp. Odt1-22]